MAKKQANSKQVSQYDKILHENLEAALPGIIKNVLEINAVESEELPDGLQHTKERKPDVLKKVKDINGKNFILHIEFQLKNDPDMAYRMAEYLIMLLRIYRLPVKQYLIYIGEGTINMPAVLENEGSFFRYNQVAISKVDYNVFLNSTKTEEKVFAILANFGNDGAITAIRNIYQKILQSVPGELERARRENQLRILAQLRNFELLNEDFMESLSTVFKEENDIYYKIGFEKGKHEFVKYLLEHTDYSIEKIAETANVYVSTVERIKSSLNNGR